MAAFALAACLAAGCASSPASAQDAAPSLSDKDWQEALAAIRSIALDKHETDEKRANAVTAGVKALLWKRQHDEALKLCREVLGSAERTGVIEAALRAGCGVERDRCLCLRAELDFLAGFNAEPHRQVAAALSHELERALEALKLLAGKAVVPGPLEARPPHWATASPGTAPGALRVELPKIQPPPWYGRVSFPPLSEPKKK